MYIVVYFASNSTMDSTASALQLTAGKRTGTWIGLLMIAGWIPVSNLGLLDTWLAMFAWFPLIFAWQIVTYFLEKNGVLSPVSNQELQARDALPLIEHEHIIPVGSR